MAIRLRTVEGVRIAVCAAETDPKPDDVYLDDRDHHALVAKFEQDKKTMGFHYIAMPLEWMVMDKERIRPVCGDDE